MLMPQRRRHCHSHFRAWRDRVAVLIPARSPRRHILIIPIRSPAIGTPRPYTLISRRIQRSLIIAGIAGVRLMSLHIESGELSGVLVDGGAATQRRRTVGSREGVGDHALLGEAVVVCGTVHIRILGDALLARFPADESSAHGAGDDAGGDDEDCGSQYDPSSPCHVRNEQQNIDQKREQCHQQRRKRQNEQRQQIPRRMRRPMEMRGNRQPEANQREQRRDRMHDQNRRQTVPGVGGQGEVAVGVGAGEEAVRAVADDGPATDARFDVAVAQHAEVVALEAAEGDSFDDGRGEGTEEEQDEGEEEDDAEGGCRA